MRSNAQSEGRLSIRVDAGVSEGEQEKSWACCSWLAELGGYVMSIGAEHMIVFVESLEQSRQVM